MPLNRSYRRYRSRRRKSRVMGGISRSFRGSRYRKPMTTGKVKRIVGAELKHRLFGQGFNNVSVAAPVIISITQPIAIGDSATSRTGNWIKPIVFHGYLSARGFPGAATTQYGIRFSVIRWNEDQTNNAITVGKIMEDVAAAASPFNVVNTGAFKVVWTRYFQVINDVANPKFVQTRKFYVRLSGAPRITYTGANPKKFQYYIVITTDDLSAAEHPQYLLDAFFRYTDS